MEAPKSIDLSLIGFEPIVESVVRAYLQDDMTSAEYAQYILQETEELEKSLGVHSSRNQA